MRLPPALEHHHSQQAEQPRLFEHVICTQAVLSPKGWQGPASPNKHSPDALKWLGALVLSVLLGFTFKSPTALTGAKRQLRSAGIQRLRRTLAVMGQGNSNGSTKSSDTFERVSWLSSPLGLGGEFTHSLLSASLHEEASSR